MQASISIEEKLLGQYKSFLKYCQEAGKKVVDELDREDFIAYRSEYAVPRKQVEQIKTLLNFQEKKSGKEISPPQNISDVPNDSLQNYFGIDDLAPYENILIVDLDFESRVKRRLKFNGYRTLAELLRTSPQKLLSSRGCGVSYFNKILSTLKKFFAPRKKKIQAKTLRLAKEELDEFLREAALNHAPQIDLIIAAFEKFSAGVSTKKLFRKLHDKLKNKRVHRYLSACNLKEDNFFVVLPKDLTFADADENLDEFLRDAALSHAPQIDLIIAAFEKFSAAVSTKKLFRYLPNDFKNKRARPFLLACSLKDANFFIDLPDDLTLAQLPEYLIENSIDFSVDSLKAFANALHFDVKACAKKIVSALFKDEREFNIVYRRADRGTLEEIGKNFGVTRERVRQIESKSVERFMKRRVAAKKIFYFIHALTDGKFLLTLDDMEKFMEARDAKIIYFLAVKTDLRSDFFHFDKVTKVFVFKNGIDFDGAELIENLPDVMEEKIFEETITDLAREKNLPAEFIRNELSKIYNRRGKIFHRGRLTLAFEFGYVLKERFPNGYKIADKTFYQRFMRHIQEIFDEKTPLTQRNVDAKIGIIGFLCGRGKYIHSDFVHISPEIMERVKNFIDSSDRTAIFYKEIFESLKNIFADTQITNHYFLQGAIKLYKLPYTLRKDYLTKASEIDMGKEFDSFVAERGEVSTQEIKENFISFKDFNIAFLVGRCPEIIRIGDGTLIHATHLNLHEEDFAAIKKFLRQNCSTAVNSRILFDLFFERFADFMTRNEIQNHNKLFAVLRYMFRDDFNFSRPYISVADVKDINNKKFLLRLLTNMEEIEIEDLISICEENRVNYLARTYLIDSLRPDFVRVDEFTLMRPESIGITDEIISAVAENIRSAVERNGGWQAAQTFDDYEWLPQLEIPWNSFLLESVVLLADGATYTLKIPSTSAKFSSTVFLSEEFVEDDFQSFLLKILSAEHAKEPFRSEKEIFNWLKAQGLCNKKLPKFLGSGRAFELLGE